MSSIEKVLETLEANKLELKKDITAQVDAKVAESVEKATSDTVTELKEKLTALEAKIANVNIVKSVGGKSALQETHRDLVSRIKAGEHTIKVLEDRALRAEINKERRQIREASTLTGSGVGIGARIDYRPQFVTKRQMNPLRELCQVVTLSDPSYQFRQKTGNAGVTWGYTVDQTNAAGNNGAVAYTINTSDLNVRFDVRRTALDDVDGLERNIMDDLFAEALQAEAGAMQQNDQSMAAGAGYQVGPNGVRGLDSYAASGTLAAGAVFPAVVSATGAHNIATVCQATVATTTAVNVKYTDLINCIYAIPEQYLSMGGFTFVVSRQYLGAIRNLVDNNGAPIFERINTLNAEGIIGMLFGYPVVMSEYIDTPLATATPSTRYPLYFGQFGRNLILGDQYPGTLQRFTETVPGSITYFYEKRVLAQIEDPIPFARIASAF